MQEDQSSNFGFLAGYEGPLLQLAIAAERAVAADPNTTLVKLRQLAEALGRHAAAASGVYSGPTTSLLDLLRALEARGIVEREVAQLFHALRQEARAGDAPSAPQARGASRGDDEGNRAVHDFVGSRQRAVDHLMLARRLAIWFHRSFGGAAAAGFKPGPFVAPEDPSSRLRALEDELARARAEAAGHQAAAADAQRIAELEARRRAEADAARARAEAEAVEWEALARQIEDETNRRLQDFERALSELQSEAKESTETAQRARLAMAVAATTQLDLDEQETRVLIDAQLRGAGWEVDSRVLRFGLGARPEKNKNRAIAEWPTDDGIADYVLFAGLVPVGIVEAKRKRKNVLGAIEQSKRYARALRMEPPLAPPIGTTGDAGAFQGWPVSSQKGERLRYRVPFLYSTNGRPWLKQHETESGTWFLDARRPSNHPRALDGWHAPDTLLALLDADPELAHAALAQEPTDYLQLRDYQLRAIGKVEDAIAAGQRAILVAMATGTGKTRTVIGLVYRLLKTKRFRRVLFLVDRNALGVQAQNVFKEMRLENTQTFAEIYEVKELADIAPEPETRVHVATVQGMARRILWPASDGERVPIDRYDCIIVDESHRGYTLDREMTEGEQELRSFIDYVSTYRRVLDHFDAVKIGLTATPALHTREIFGDAVYTYTYREAVVDGWLVDHEPPVRIVTRLAKHGIHFAKGAEVQVLHAGGALQLSLLPDELDFDVDEFNRQVITEGFNRAVAAELVGELDPFGDEKSLLYCVNDAHATLLVKLLKEAFEKRFDKVDDDAIMKITGSIDRPLEAIRRFKNERLPSIAVTVDLLTTGIDVPAISSLVFIRRVRSRILYEQMLGRATRLCDEIGKEVFRIYDCVDLYAALEPVTSMKPVVKDASVGVRQLVDDLLSPKSALVQGGEPGRTHADEVLDQLVEKLRRHVRRIVGSGKKDEVAKATIEDMEALLGFAIEELPGRLHHLGAARAARLFQDQPELLPLVERLAAATGSRRGIVVAPHDDEVIAVETGYGTAGKPGDYLDEFKRFIDENLNRIPALSVVLRRPRDLTRAELRELKLQLDLAGYSEVALRAAWREVKNEDIAATIIGFIRQRALGSPLVPYAQRVDRALDRILASQSWTHPQRKWLQRLAEQMKQEVIVDDEALSKGAFVNHGGRKGVDQALGGRLQQVLDDLGDAVWSDAQVA